MMKRCKKEYIPFLAGMLAVLLALSRYIVNGEPVDVRSDAADLADGITLSDGMEIMQPLTIPEGSSWRQGYYALFVSESSPDSAGKLVYTLQQGDRQDTQSLSLGEMTGGTWVRLQKLPLKKLESGMATLLLRTEGVAEGELEIAAGPDFYGFGNFSLNGNAQQTTLAQACHYHVTGTEYTIRLVCYGIVLLCAAILVLLVFAGAEKRESAEKSPACFFAFSVLTVFFMAVIYLVDSSVYLEPTYAEAVTNFLRFAREEKLTANLLIADAGYLPLLPRLITLFYVKLLRVPASAALYFMQGTACLLCSMVWAFFVLSPFKGLMRFPNRILWCMLVMMTCFCEETLFFTNHAYWGIYLLLLLLVADLEAFSRWVYAGLLGAAALVCLSKGTYAVMLPLMLFYLLLFWKSIGRRARLLAFVTGAASLMQLLYSFGGQGDGGGWIDAASMGQAAYWLRLAGRLAVELGAVLLTPLREILWRLPFSGILAGAAGVTGLVVLAAGFVVQVLCPLSHGKKVDRQRVIFYTLALFLVIVSAFFLVTVKRVPDSWETVGKIGAAQIGSKYEIFSNVGFYMLLLTGCALLREREKCGKTGSRKGLIAAAGQTVAVHWGVVLLMVLFGLTSPVLQLTGWAGAGISDERVYAGTINTAWQDGRKLLSENAFFLPVREDYWAYSRNINLYQVGTAFYFEETSCFNVEEELAGRHSSYEIEDVALGQNVIEVLIERPLRVDRPSYRVQLLDAAGNVIAEADQMDAGRNKKCLFRFAEPVSGVKTIAVTDTEGNPVFFKEYIAWACAW